MTELAMIRCNPLKPENSSTKLLEKLEEGVWVQLLPLKAEWVHIPQ